MLDSVHSLLNGEKRVQYDTWIGPSPLSKYRTSLYLNNSMAGEKVEFIPFSKTKHVTWYGCGPTVYDAAHLGHARTYISFDIVRRVMTNYFNYHIFMCMNITDIDDKIIQRSQEQNIEFSQLARHWEMMFWKDMQKLNILYPDVITRVSEYIPEIISFIQGILDQEFAYVSEGSVYFDTQKFREAPQHVYGRMDRNAINDAERVLEGEGTLGIIGEKKCTLDFALWKKAKPKEPSWDSPWGLGRPGWHIECSTMASSVLGFPIDIHSGGIDLRFPHHDNELAQSEARYNKPQWVNYFLHSGHLHIKGSKMSKSLKNFITIEHMLETTSARVIRLLFLKQRWDCPMNFTVDGDSMNEAQEIDRNFIHFFALINSMKRQAYTETTSNTKLISNEQKWRQIDNEFHQKIQDAQSRVDDALCDNIDTPTALQCLRSLMTATNVYMKESFPRFPLILKSAEFIFKLVKIFGLTNGSESTFAYAETVQSDETSDQTTKLMDLIISFRADIRNEGKEISKFIKKEDVGGMKPHLQAIFQKCDDVRDRQLIGLGYILEDGKESSTWRTMTKEEKREHVKNDEALKQST